LASPLEPVVRPASKVGLRQIAALAHELGAERIVVGLPVSLGGGDSAQTREARQFADRLAAVTKVPIELYDERFTTSLAQQAGGEASLDSRAAAVLLDEWLNVRGTAADRGGSGILDQEHHARDPRGPR
jgi:putative Holliday junction resolvase